MRWGRRGEVVVADKEQARVEGEILRVGVGERDVRNFSEGCRLELLVRKPRRLEELSLQ